MVSGVRFPGSLYHLTSPCLRSPRCKTFVLPTPHGIPAIGLGGLSKAEGLRTTGTWWAYPRHSFGGENKIGEAQGTWERGMAPPDPHRTSSVTFSAKRPELAGHGEEWGVGRGLPRGRQSQPRWAGRDLWLSREVVRTPALAEGPELNQSVSPQSVSESQLPAWVDAAPSRQKK